MDEDWHAICQTIFKGVEGEGGRRRRKNGRSCTASTKNYTMQPVQRSRENARMTKAKNHGLNCCDLGSATQIEARCQVRMALWEARMRNPAEEVFRRTEERAPSRKRVQRNTRSSISSPRWWTMRALASSGRLVPACPLPAHHNPRWTGVRALGCAGCFRVMQRRLARTIYCDLGVSKLLMDSIVIL